MKKPLLCFGSFALAFFFLTSSRDGLLVSPDFWIGTIIYYTELLSNWNILVILLIDSCILNYDSYHSNVHFSRSPVANRGDQQKTGTSTSEVYKTEGSRVGSIPNVHFVRCVLYVAHCPYGNLPQPKSKRKQQQQYEQHSKHTQWVTMVATTGGWNLEKSQLFLLRWRKIWVSSRTWFSPSNKNKQTTQDKLVNKQLSILVGLSLLLTMCITEYSSTSSV